MDENARTQNFSEAEKEGIEFIRVDFSECFNLMRHYDDQIVNICKFAFFAYSGILASAVGIYKYGVEKNIDLRFSACSITGAGLIVGLFLFAIVIRNRIYFIRTVRYINEIRGFFLENISTIFKKKSGMYTKCESSRYFSLFSSQLFISYVISFLNTIILGALLYIITLMIWKHILIVCVLFWSIQLSAGLLHLKLHDCKFKKAKKKFWQKEPADRK